MYFFFWIRFGENIFNLILKTNFFFSMTTKKEEANEPNKLQIRLTGSTEHGGLSTKS